MHTSPSRSWKQEHENEADTPPKHRREDAGAPNSKSSSSSCTSRPSPTDTAFRKKKKSKKNKKQSKSPAPGFDLTKKPGEEKNTVFDFMQRLKHAPHGSNSAQQLGICYHTVEVKEGNMCCHQSTLIVTAEDGHGVPYAWSGQEFKGEAVRKAWAENAAAKAFLDDGAVQETAANMDPAYAKKPSQSQKRRLTVLKEFRRAKRAAAAAGGTKTFARVV